MSRRRASVLATLSLALGLLVVLAGPAPSASALPSVCTDPLASRPQHVYVWKGNGTNHDWANPGNWEHNPGADPTFLGYPNDDTNNNGASDRTSTVVCISVASPDFVSINYNTFGGAFVWLKEMYVEGPFTVQTTADNTGLLIDGTTNPSSFGPGSTLDLRGTFGGFATINMFGTMTATSTLNVNGSFPSQLTSRKICGTDGTTMPFCPAGSSLEQDYTGPAGTLVIKPGGSLTLTRRGVGLSYHYNLDIQGSMRIDPNPGGGASETPYLAAADGTSLDVMGGGTLTFAGNGGVYRGKIINSQPLSVLHNAGTVVKTGVGTNSVVDTDYSLQPGGSVDIQSGTLTLPQGAAGPATLTAQVDGGSTLGTGTCGAVVPADGGSACTPNVGGADPRSLSVTMPTGDTDGAAVLLREDVPTGGLAFDGITEISGLKPLPSDPAKIQARLPTVPSDTDLDTVAVTPEAGGAAYPTCLGSGAPPFGALTCVDRREPPNGSRVVGGNLYMEVRSVANARSRWIVLRGSADVAAPTLYGDDRQKGKLKPGQAKPVLVKGLRCSEDCTLTAAKARLVVRVKGTKHTFRLKGSTSPDAGDEVSLKLKLLTPEKKRELRNLGASKGKVTLLLKARDGSRNTVTMSVKIRLT